MCYLLKGCALLFSAINYGTDQLECEEYNGSAHNSFRSDSNFHVGTPDDEYYFKINFLF